MFHHRYLTPHRLDSQILPLRPQRGVLRLSFVSRLTFSLFLPHKKYRKNYNTNFALIE